MPTFKGGKGVNKDVIPSELELGVWSDMLNFRTRNGSEEKVGGITEITTAPSVIPYSVIPYLRDSLLYGGSVSYILCGTQKVYEHNGAAPFEITRPVSAVSISSMSRINSTTTEIVTSSAHGLVTNNDIRVTGCTPSTHNSVEANITVINSTTLRYTPDVSTGAGAITPGAYKVLQGPSNNFALSSIDRWSGGQIGSQFLINAPDVGLYYWPGISAYDMVPLDITTYPSQIARPFKDWLVLLAPTISSTKYPCRVMWSARVEPGGELETFDAAATNDAGFVDLVETRGPVVDFLPLGDVAYIYKTDEIYAMRWIGGNQVFRFDRLHDTHGLFWPACIANTEIGQVFLSRDMDIRIHNGQRSRSIAEGRVKNYLQSNISTTNSFLSFVQSSTMTKEVWVCFPESGQSACTKALVWNWEADAWSIRSLPNVTAATEGLLPATVSATNASPRVIIATSAPKFGYTEAGTTDLGATITGTLERTGIHFDARRRKKTLHSSRWDIDATNGNTASIYHGSHIHPDEPASYASAVTFTQNTTRDVNAFASSAEHCAIKLTTTATDLKVRSIEIDVNEDGDF